MNKSDLIAHVASEVNLPRRVAARVVDSVINRTTQCLRKGESVKVIGFGTFSTARRPDPPPPRMALRYTDFGSPPPDDPTDLQEFARRVRKGQARLRRALLRLYDSKCAITGQGPASVLEVAHIDPH